MSTISFKATLHQPDETAKVGPWTVLTLPKSASDKLPSRGMTIVEGRLNRVRFRAILEPDGQGSHWFRVNKAMCEGAKVEIGSAVSLEIEPAKVWPEPTVTTDVKNALKADPQANAVWTDITPMARWDWLNWMDAVKQAETRKERPQKLISMLKAGKRRPCCFNRTVLMTPKSAELL